MKTLLLLAWMMWGQEDIRVISCGDVADCYKLAQQLPAIKIEVNSTIQCLGDPNKCRIVFHPAPAKAERKGPAKPRPLLELPTKDSGLVCTKGKLGSCMAGTKNGVPCDVKLATTQREQPAW